MIRLVLRQYRRFSQQRLRWGKEMKIWQDKHIRNAILIGSLCSVSYFVVYIARNMLSAVTPQILEEGTFTTEYIGSVSSMFFVFYAVGQLINGMIGDRLKARYMMSVGLIMAGICNWIFPYIFEQELWARIIYGMSGFFLAMIFAPMTKVVAENTKPAYAVRCSMGYEFGALLGSPVAGLAATFFAWETSFHVGSVALVSMGVICFCGFLQMEKRGIVRYNRYNAKEKTGLSGIKVLVKHQIIKFTLISIITGIVRTSVVFWLPTYSAQYLGFSPKMSATIFTIATLAISTTTFIAIFVYEKLHENMDLTILLSFSLAMVCFIGTYFVKQPMINIVLLVFAIMSSNGAATMLWSRYCPSLRDTGMVSGATGFLDFVSYMAAAASSVVFADAVTKIGWGNLIFVWFGLMVCGVIVAIPKRKRGEVCET